MNFEFTSEQEQLRETVARALQQTYSFEGRNAILETPERSSPDLWIQLAELGVLGLIVPENDGGFGGTAVETMIVMEEVGRTLALEPLLTTAIMGAELLASAPPSERRDRLLSALLAGELRVAPAIYEAGARYDPDLIETSALPSGDSWVLEGHKSLVLDGAGADLFIVVARTRDESSAPRGLALFLVESTADGIHRQPVDSHDGHRLCDLELRGVELRAEDVLAGKEAARPLIQHCLDSAVAALCAEAVGAMQASFDLTLEYLKTRKQFGVAIGSFQSLQHRAVEMLQQLEQARSMSYLAAARLAAKHDDEARRSVSAAKYVVGEAARFIGEQAVQLHGAIGMTDEYAIGHYFKRLTAIGVSFGDADYHLQRLLTYSHRTEPTGRNGSQQ